MFNDSVECPICENDAYLIDNSLDGFMSAYYYCCSMQPFYHIYKANNEEILYYCNTGRIVINMNMWDLYDLNPKVEIIYTGGTIEEKVQLSSLPEFDAKQLPMFIKTAVRNVAFL